MMGKVLIGYVADFVIGAHARAMDRLVARDAAFYERNFPKLTVLVPNRS